MPRKIKGLLISDVTLSYLTTALWSSTVSLPCEEDELVDGRMDCDEDHPLHGILEQDFLDGYFEVDDFSEESLREAEEECRAWFDELDNTNLYDRARKFVDDSHIAHDFWLTRNGHGAGYWDGDYDGDDDEVGKELTTACEAWGGLDIWIDNDGTLYFE